jgi:hypothetical protein
MKTLLLLATALFLGGCYRQSLLVTVGQNRTHDPGVIKDYSFYSKEFVEFFDALPNDARRGIQGVSAVSGNSLRFSFRSASRQTTDSSIAGLFQDFAYANYKKTLDQWDRHKGDILKPVFDLELKDPELFRQRVTSLIEMPTRPTIEVYVLRIE